MADIRLDIPSRPRVIPLAPNSMCSRNWAEANVRRIWYPAESLTLCRSNSCVRLIVEHYLPALLTTHACHVRSGEQRSLPDRFAVRNQILPEARIALIPLEA